MAADRKSMNRQAIEEFANYFTPPLKVVATDSIGGARVAHGWMCAFHDPEYEIGLTAVCWGSGHFKSWVEATGSRDEAGFAGYAMSHVVSTLMTPFDSDCDPIAGAEHAKALEASEGADDAFEWTEDVINYKPSKTGFKSAMYGSPSPDELAKRPNPEFIDMMGLTSLERVKACEMYPNLRFSVNAGKRYDSNGGESEHAGLIRGDQLEHVRRAMAAAPLKDGCDHKFKNNPEFGYQRCIKCGGDDPLRFNVDVDARRLVPRGHGCDHDFKPNSIGGDYTCEKCGIERGIDQPPDPPYVE